ncbi:MAG TPA: YkgJ family cysteine cluster protein [Planctomycetota bacterium]|nr:YkgJ family cysteine cluster protein [Planctomycetota bacterium]HRR81286.1 YkgJ family cysteine cluster protein [Planctomycetota bacterium]HRT96008.1 YkgJ family cysteine cluster protein [Planctomycetota bacterium]
MPELILPPGVRYTCLRCGACCRTLEVTLTDAERGRLLAHDWSAEVPGFTEERVFARRRGAAGKQVWRLRPRADGACVFLTGENLCRVHARLGYAAKPFAGRVFPFGFVVTPVGVFVGCRFNCPAVVRGKGPTLAEQRGEIQRLFAEYAATYEPPREDDQVRFFGHWKVSWRDVLRIEEQLVAFLGLPEVPFARRLLACWMLVRQFVSQALRQKSGERMGADPDEVLARAKEATPKGRLGLLEGMLVRLTVGAFAGASPHYCRELPLVRRLFVRLGNLGRRLKLALGVGKVRFPGLLRAAKLRDARRVGLTRLDGEATAMLERYFAAKVSSQGFFGLACFGRSFAQGFELLAAAYVAVLWLAGARAASEGRSAVGAGDIEYGIEQVDFGYNYLAELGGLSTRMRGAILWHWATVGKALLTLAEPTPKAE